MSAHPQRILIVDDNEDIRMLLSHGFKRGGYEVATASSGNDAFAKTQAGNFDLILCDVQMPDGTGVDLLKQMTSAGIELPVFLFTADLTFDRKIALSLGAREVFRKPVTAHNLMYEIEKNLAS